MPTITAVQNLTFSQRAEYARHPLAARLFNLMEAKKSNLAFAADTTKADELLHLAEKLGPYLCVIKTHIDFLDDFTPEVSKRLLQIAEKHNFLIFEDRKFADIGNTVAQQYQSGIYRISDWSHITNAHSISGPGVIEGLQQVGKPKGNGLLLLAQLSSEGNLIDEKYTRETVAMALRYPEFVMGFICQKKLTDEPGMIHMTPGVQLGNKGDALGQQYNTPHYAIFEQGSDIAIVGRGILKHSQPVDSAKEYRDASWHAYQLKIAK